MGAVCPSWLSFILYNPVRKVLTDREKVLKESGITGNTVVLEIGAGNGFFTEVIAPRARKVIAVELQEGMIRKLESRTKDFRDKVDIVQGDISSLDLGEGIADVCLMYYCFHEVGDQAEAAARICRAVKKDGILSIYEPTIEVDKQGMEKAIGMFEKCGFSRELGRDQIATRFARLRKR